MFTRPGWPEIAVGMIIYLTLLAILSVVILRIPDGQSGFRGNVGMAFNGAAGLVALCCACAIRIRALPVFGFRPSSWNWLLCGLGLGILAYFVSHIMEHAYFLFVTEMNTQADFQAAAKAGGLQMIVLLVTGVILTPLGEEAVFRGIVANAFNRYSPSVAVVGSALIFAAVHGPSVVFLNALLIGIITGILFRKADSLWPGFVVHAVFNGLWLVTYALA